MAEVLTYEEARKKARLTRDELSRRTGVSALCIEWLEKADLATTETRKAVAAELGLRCCHECGCTDATPCEGGCWWIGLALCSSCHAKAVERHKRPQGEPGRGARRA